MTDIVERLRERARGGHAHDELDEEAADEIERLRGPAGEVWHDICAENDNLRAEIERLHRKTECLRAEVKLYFDMAMARRDC
jgi:hypothetical protein